MNNEASIKVGAIEYPVSDLLNSCMPEPATAHCNKYMWEHCNEAIQNMLEVQRAQIESLKEEVKKANESEQSWRNMMHEELGENLQLFARLGIDSERIGNEPGVTGINLIHEAVDAMKAQLASQEKEMQEDHKHMVERLGFAEKELQALRAENQTLEGYYNGAESARQSLVREMFDAFGNNGLAVSFKDQVNDLRGEAAQKDLLLQKLILALESINDLVKDKNPSKIKDYETMIDAVIRIYYRATEALALTRQQPPISLLERAKGEVIEAARKVIKLADDGDLVMKEFGHHIQLTVDSLTLALSKLDDLMTKNK